VAGLTVPLISIVIPTVTGREDHFERCREAYRTRTAARYEILAEKDHATCGLAWQAGADRSTGDYLHFTCDDLEPLAGWDTAAIACTDAGAAPAPKVTDARNGALQSRPTWGQEFPDGIDTGMSLVPFLTRQMWEAVRPLFVAHYDTDTFISFRAREAGWIPVMCNGYAFLHHWAQVRRGANMGSDQIRMVHDQVLYEQAVAMVRAGTWFTPWPPDGG
jgi:hypothetical protein